MKKKSYGNFFPKPLGHTAFILQIINSFDAPDLVLTQKWRRNDVRPTQLKDRVEPISRTFVLKWCFWDKIEQIKIESLKKIFLAWKEEIINFKTSFRFEEWL